MQLRLTLLSPIRLLKVLRIVTCSWCLLFLISFTIPFPLSWGFRSVISFRICLDQDSFNFVHTLHRLLQSFLFIRVPVPATALAALLSSGVFYDEVRFFESFPWFVEVSVHTLRYVNLKDYDITACDYKLYILYIIQWATDIENRPLIILTM